MKASGEEAPFKAKAAELFVAANGADRLALHYGMCIATYPYFLALSRILGRLFKLQGEVNSSEFTRRVIESVGDRDSIKRASARYLQSMSQWGVIEATGKSGFVKGERGVISSTNLATWLYNSLIYSLDKDMMSVDEIISDPAWFPFSFNGATFDFNNSNLVRVLHRDVGNVLITMDQK